MANEPLNCCVAIVLIYAWRFLQTTTWQRFEGCRRLDHYWFKRHTPVFQWYSFATFLLSLGLLAAVKDILLYDYYKMAFLSPEKYMLRVADVTDPSGNELGGHLIPTWMRILAVMAPVVGVIAFVLMVRHIVVYMRKCKEDKVDSMTKKETGIKKFEVGDKVLERSKRKSSRIGVIKSINLQLYRDAMVDMCQVVWNGEDGDAAFMLKDDLSFHLSDTNPWVADKVEDLTILVIMTPGVFIVMAMWAEIRAIQMLTASSVDYDDWDNFLLWRSNTYLMDLECAALFQYLTVLGLGMLCASFFGLEPLAMAVELEEKRLILEVNSLKEDLSTIQKPDKYKRQQSLTKVDSILRLDLEDASADHKMALTWVGLQGIWAYILVGSVRCLFDIVTFVLKEEEQKKWLERCRTVRPYMHSVFIFSSVLCIFNIVLVLRVRELKTVFGEKASLRFLAARALLILNDGQPVIIHLVAEVTDARFSEFHGYLIHAVLLMFECLLVVIFNMWAWSMKLHPNSDFEPVGSRGREEDYRRVLSKSLKLRKSLLCAKPDSVTHLSGIMPFGDEPELRQRPTVAEKPGCCSLQ